MKRQVFYNTVELGFIDLEHCTVSDITVAVAVMNGKCIDELTLADYEASQKVWINVMIRMLPATYMRKKSHQLQAILMTLNKEILKPLRNQKRKRGCPKKYPKK